MKQIAHVDKKWQSSVTAYVEVTYEDGSHKYYLEGRYGGGTLTAEAYALAKPNKPTAWKRYRRLAGRPGIEVKIIDPNGHLQVVSYGMPAIKEEMQ
jgi:hypothetical protein